MKLCISIIIFFIIIVVYYEKQREMFVESKLDKRKYQVIDRFGNHDKAADFLAKVNIKNQQFIAWIVEKYKDCDKCRGTFLAERLKKHYRPDALVENDPPDPFNTSYTDNKGEKMALCIRDPKTQEFEDLNLVTFVSLHELAHIASIEYGHEDEFWINFKYLLKAATEAGLYNPVDYSVNPVDYCGLEVTYNPLYDVSLSSSSSS